MSIAENSRVDEMERQIIGMRWKGIDVMTATDFQPEHYFAPGLYARCLPCKKGMFIVGHAQKNAHLSILLSGKMRVLSNGKVREITGPSRPWLTEANTRKAGLVLEDSVLITFHPSRETDLGRLEEELIEKSPEFCEFEQASRLMVENQAVLTHKA